MNKTHEGRRNKKAIRGNAEAWQDSLNPVDQIFYMTSYFEINHALTFTIAVYLCFFFTRTGLDEYKNLFM